jgi:selenocysteine lyase/cysteine desulfurase
LGLGEAARYALAAGIGSCGRRARELARTLRQKLATLEGFRVLDHGAELAAIVTVEVPGWRAPDLVIALRERHINTSATLREYAVIDMDEKRAQTALRISPHYYNTEAELDAVVGALDDLARNRRNTR